MLTFALPSAQDGSAQRQGGSVNLMTAFPVVA
jgi:hypothetical protein